MRDLVRGFVAVLWLFLCLPALPVQAAGRQPGAPAYIGTASCRECHERFYQLWSTSFHGRAMQPVTAEFLQQLTPQAEDIVILGRQYRADIGSGAGWLIERGPQGEKKYPIVHAVGGKNVYYFLTPLEKGRLQVLPLGYDVRTKRWFDAPATHIRPTSEQPAQPLPWKDAAYTFNTSCYGCHVSQLSTNYNLKTNTYHTTWAEPGINCETCHGPSGEHVRVTKEAPKGEIPKDLKIIITKTFTPDQHNSSCSSCHAKLSPITPAFKPGERYFDHYDLVTLEDPDFYPDGRDLGENYTLTSWRMSPCVASGKLSCMHCHTSSGRFRFRAEPNKACAPCHQAYVDNPPAHTNHPVEAKEVTCLSCHMPMTAFAAMRRSDHSMRPPAPAATLAFKSPNACNQCHADKDASWADQLVRQWRPRDYQAPVLYRAGLVDAARKQDWSRLPEMLAYLEKPDRDEVTATSLIRLLQGADDARKWPAYLKALTDPSPLVRGAAASALTGYLTPESVPALLKAVRDEIRLVRVRAAAALAGLPPQTLRDPDRKALDRAVRELEAGLRARPDDYTSHYNLGNFYLSRRDPPKAIGAFETSSRLRPDSILPLVNASIAYSQLNQNDKAEASLRRALKIEPANAVVNLNLGMLLAEQGRPKEAEAALRTAIKSDPQSAQAAYNLCVLTAKDRPAESITWCQKAVDLRPADTRYAYTLAFYQNQRGDGEAAVRKLRGVISAQPASPDAYALLGEIYEKQKKFDEAKSVYRQAMENPRLSERDRAMFGRKQQALPPAGKTSR